jgi:gliding motility-associated-like protein
MIRYSLRLFFVLCLAAIGTIATAQVAPVTANAGPDAGICPGSDPPVIGGAPTASGGTPPYSYSWSPGAGLSNPSIANPSASPTVTTTYTVTVTDNNGNADNDVVTVSIYSNPVISVSPDVTIDEGQTITLHVTGGIIYYWWPTDWMLYSQSANPDVEPLSTITYHVGVVDEHGCADYDSVTVTVIPGEKLFIYNTFTPNGDGENDTWYIGNIFKYPDNKLEVYNRYGKQVFVAAPYINHWDGKNFGEELPDGTYYYVLEPGNGEPPYKGSVTIIR